MLWPLLVLASPCPAAFDSLGDCSIVCTDTRAHIVNADGRELDVLLTDVDSGVRALTQAGVCHRTSERAPLSTNASMPSRPPEPAGGISRVGQSNQIAASAAAEPFAQSGQLRVDYVRTVSPRLDVGTSLGFMFLVGEHKTRLPFWFSVVTAGAQVRVRIAQVGPATFGARGVVELGYGASDETTYDDFDFNRTVGWGASGAFVGSSRVEAMADVRLGRFAFLFSLFGGLTWQASTDSKGVREWKRLPADAPNPVRWGAAPLVGARIGAAVAMSERASLLVNAELANTTLVHLTQYLPVTFTLSLGPSFAF